MRNTRVRLNRNQPYLTWAASRDDLGLGGYYVYREDELYATLDNRARRFRDIEFEAETTYTYRVEAFDLAGNTASSPDVLITTR